MIPRVFKPIYILAVLAIAGCDSVDERVAGHYSRAQELIEAGDRGRAIVELRNAIKLDDKFIPARMDLANLLRRRERLRPAIGQLLKVVDLQPDHVGARQELANIFLLANQLDDALKHSEAAYRVAQDDPNVLALRATIAIRLGNLDFAEKLAERAIAIDPFHSSSGVVLSAHRLRSGDVEAALEIIDRYIGYDETKPELQLARLQIVAQRKDTAEIGAQLRRMVELFPDDVGFIRGLVRWRVRNGEKGLIEGDLRKLASLQPGELAPVLDLVRHVIRERGPEAGRNELIAQIEAAEDKFALQSSLAEMDFRSGQKAEAVSLVQSIVAQDGPDANKARLLLARFRVAERQPDAAAALLEEALKNDAKNVGALSMRAALRLDAGDVGDAIVDLRAALAEAPRDVSSLLLIARAFEMNGKYELASERYAAAMQASDYDESAAVRYAEFLTRTNQPAAMEIVLTEASRRQPSSKPILRRLAEVRLRLQKWVEAEDAARKLNALENDGSFADRALVSALSGQQRFQESVAVLKDLAEEPDNANSAMSGLFAVYLQSGREDEAARFLQDVLEANADNAQALMLRGVLAMRQGDAAAAEKDLVRATDLTPELPGGYRALAEFYSKSGRPDEAMDTLEKGISSVTEAEGLRLLKAMEHEKRAEIDAAIDQYRDIIERNPNSLVVVNNLASLLSDHYGDDPEKLAYAVRIGAPLQVSTQPAFQDTYGWLRYLSGDYDAALKSLLPAVEALPGNPWVQYHVGMTFAKLKQAPEARTHLTKALEIGGDGFPPANSATEALAALAESEN